MNTRLKAIVTAIVSAVGAVTVALATTSTGDIGDISTRNWLVAAGAVLGSGVLVQIVTNSAAAPIAKAAVATLSAGIASLVVALDDDMISQAEWLTAFTAAVLASGLVYEANEDG